MATKVKKVSFQERLRRGCRKLEAAGYEVRTNSREDVLKAARSVIRGKTATADKKAFDKLAEGSSCPVQVSIAKRNFREDGTGCEIRAGKGRPSYEDMGYTDEELGAA